MFQSLPGFRDFYPEDCLIRSHIFKIWRQVVRRFGFLEYDAPILEPLELFTEKSGNEIVTQLFSFEDRGGRLVSLRPEMTPSLARLVGGKANSLRRPVKWFNVGEQFRYERPQKGRLRSFYQLNADILGESSPAADVEIIALMISILKEFGLSAHDFYIRLSDRDLWLYYLASMGIEGEKAIEVLGVIDKLERERPEKLLERLKPFLGENAENFLERVHQLTAIQDRRELGDFMSKNLSNLDLSDKMKARLQDWDYLFKSLDKMGMLSFVKIDLGIVRGLAYYTGFVFEVFEKHGKSRALAGGGRYDHLVKKLSGSNMPAVGFAIGDVTLRDLLQEKSKLPNYVEITDFFVVYSGENERLEALKDIAWMREMGYRVEYSLKGGTLSKQFKQADQVRARYALLYGENELQAGKVKVLQLGNREEHDIARDSLPLFLQKI